MLRFRTLLGGATVLVLSGALGASAALAQQQPGRTTTTTSEHPPEPASTTTTAVAPAEEPSPSAVTTTTTPARRTPTNPTGTTSTTAPGDSNYDAPATAKARTQAPTATGDGGDGGAPGAAVSRVVPPGYQKMINSVRRSRANDTSALIAALQPLEDLGLTAQQAALIGMGRFPVAGPASFVDDWWYPRFVPEFHLHQGTDIFAAAGTPVRAPVDGVLRQSNGAVGGLASYVTQADGTYFYMAHLSGFVKGQATGQRVKTGDVVGYVGDTGNAQGGAPHVHFEIHPKGGGAVNPKPFLDRFISEAMANVPKLIAAHEVGRPRALVTTGLTRRLSEGGGVFASPSSPPRSQLLWASSANPQGGIIRLAEAEAAEAARGVDWNALARREQTRAADYVRADERARTILGPVTPAGLGEFLGLPRSPGRIVGGVALAGPRLSALAALPQRTVL
ncbi:MAG TPA: M23 family metallopeptidase [Acidimicrobiales bacterium]|nr:M23 family metallopeptidase [Acidimicrobiales bacterium]